MAKKRRKKKLTIDSFSKMERVDPKAPARRPRYIGKDYGKALTEFVASLLKMNEDSVKSRKLNDESLARAVIREYSEYPDLKERYTKEGKRWIKLLRNRYNVGDLNVKFSVPDRISFRYTNGVIGKGGGEMILSNSTDSMVSKGGEAEESWINEQHAYYTASLLKKHSGSIPSHLQRDWMLPADDPLVLEKMEIINRRSLAKK